MLHPIRNSHCIFQAAELLLDRPQVCSLKAPKHISRQSKYTTVERVFQPPQDRCALSRQNSQESSPRQMQRDTVAGFDGLCTWLLEGTLNLQQDQSWQLQSPQSRHCRPRKFPPRILHLFCSATPASFGEGTNRHDRGN